MTIITQNLADIGLADDNTAWVFYVKELRESDSGDTIITPKKVRKYPVDGVLTVELDPGPAVVLAADGKHYAFDVPDDDSDLWSLISLGVTLPPETPRQQVVDAVLAYLESNATPFGVELMTADTEAEARATIGVSNPLGNFYNMNDYPAIKGDWTGGDADDGTGTNDTAAVNALVAAAAESSQIIADASKTYRVDPTAIMTKALDLNWNGADLVTRTMSSGDLTAGAPLFRFSSALGTARAFGAVALWATTLTTTTHAHAGDFSPGDYVFVSDNFELVNWQTGSHQGAGRGEINQVVSANASTGVVTLVSPLSADYSSTYNSTTPVIQKIATPIVGATVRNIKRVIDTYAAGDYTGTYAALSTRPNIVEFDYCVDPLVENVTVDGFVLQAFHFARCMRPRAVRVHAFNPFSVASGHGYMGGMFQCTDGLFDSCESHSCRHTCDYEGGTRNGSMFCKAYDNQVRAFGPHGHESRDLYSFYDTVIGGAVNSYGWGNGNSTFAADHGYLIVGATMYGGYRGIAGVGGSDGLRIVAPNIHTPSHCIKLEYCDDTIIDTRGGVLHNTDSVTTTGRTIWADTGVAGFETKDVTIYGTEESFQGTYRAIKLALNAANTAKLIGIPAAVPVTIDSGTADYGKNLGSGVSLTDPKINTIYDANGAAIWEMVAVASAVNRFQMNNQATGTGPQIGVAGTDTNIDWIARAKGTGLFKIRDATTGSKFAAHDVSGVTGVRTFKYPDASGNLVICGATSTTSASSLTPVAGTPMYAYTALAANLTINAPTGSPIDGTRMLFRLKDNGTSRTLTWNSIFRAIGVTLPTATTISKTLYVGTVYNAADTKYDVLAVGLEA